MEDRHLTRDLMMVAAAASNLKDHQRSMDTVLASYRPQEVNSKANDEQAAISYLESIQDVNWSNILTFDQEVVQAILDEEKAAEDPIAAMYTSRGHSAP